MKKGTHVTDGFLATKLRELPKVPGVYLMKDGQSKIIYVGKAKNLKSRVSSYFSRGDQGLKTKRLVAEISDFEIMIAKTEVEALLLERTLIKHHAPKFNILLRDDKEFPYIRIDYQQQWPRLDKVRRRQDDGATYIGPFGNAGHLNTTLKTMMNIFPLVRCSTYEFERAKRPCTYYHMNLCLGPCVYQVERQEYLETLQACEAILKGQSSEVQTLLGAYMKLASENQQFEKAARYRDQIAAMAGLSQSQVAVTTETEDADVIGIYLSPSHIAFHVLFVREYAIIGGDTFVVKQSIASNQEALTAFIMQYYEHRYLPKELIIPLAIESRAQLLEALQSSTRCKITLGQGGERRHLVQMAQRNATHSLGEAKNLSPHRHIELSKLQETLGLEVLPVRIECIDISNLQNQAIVASSVCFIDGKPAKEHYRKYQIKSVTETHDDYASIKEVVARRLKRGLDEDNLPQLLVIDGGKGQLAAAQESLGLFPDLDLAIVGLAKSRSSYDGHGRLSQSFERVFKLGQAMPINLIEGTPAFRLLTHIRDEAHRFAIRYHRKKRQQNSLTSVLDDIPGVGPVLKNRLLIKFHDLAGLRKASAQQLTTVKGINEKLASQILSLLNP